MPHDYSTAPAPRKIDLIEPGTIATIVIHLRPGGVGEDGLLKRSQKGDCEMLDIEYVLVDGPSARRKFWENQIINGTTSGHESMAKHYVEIRRKILQSARGIKEGDMSPQARAAYMADLKDFDGLMFIGEVGVEKGKPRPNGSGNYDDRNILAAVITPDQTDWHPVTQAAPFDVGNGAAAPNSASSPGAPPSANPTITPPDWAR